MKPLTFFGFALFGLATIAGLTASVAVRAATSASCTVWGGFPDRPASATVPCALTVRDANSFGLDMPDWPTMTFTRASRAEAPGDLSGNWLSSDYSCVDGAGQPIYHLTEQVAIVQSGATFVATKLTGDACVPAGHETFHGSFTPAGLLTAKPATGPAPSQVDIGSVHTQPTGIVDPVQPPARPPDTYR